MITIIEHDILVYLDFKHWLLNLDSGGLKYYYKMFWVLSIAMFQLLISKTHIAAYSIAICLSKNFIEKLAQNCNAVWTVDCSGWVSGCTRISKTISVCLSDFQRLTRQHSEFANQLNAVKFWFKYKCRVIIVSKIGQIT